MDNMKCFSCVLKHLSAALSFGKEVMSGHSKGDELDHRIDFIGEVVNAEQHLELIDKNLFNEISLFRKTLQEKDVSVDFNDLEFIRHLYLKVEMLKNGDKITSMTPEPLDENPDVVYLEVKNKAFFDLSYSLLKMHLKNYKNIYILKSDIDLSEYKDLTILNEDLRTFMKRDNITKDVLVLSENMSVLKDIDAKHVFPTFSMKLNGDILKDIKPTGEKKLYAYDGLKIEPINVDLFNKNVDSDYKYILTAYFYKSDIDQGINDLQISVDCDRPICCSTRTNLKVRTFLRWNEAAFPSLKKELGM